MQTAGKDGVMANFWLATFELDQHKDPVSSSATPLAAEDARAWAIEIIQENDEFALLFSTVDNPLFPTKLQCRIGFANGSKSCSVWRERGFPLVDAAIKHDRDGLHVYSPCFL